MKTKFRNYAWFQFMSLIALAFLLVATILLAYQGSEQNRKLADDGFWNVAIKNTLTFVKQETIGIFASIFTYLTFALWIITWILGWMILRTKNRNLFDSLFLMFLMIPLLSNMFALFAQLSLKTKDYTSSYIDKKQIREETKEMLKRETIK